MNLIWTNWTNWQLMMFLSLAGKVVNVEWDRMMGVNKRFIQNPE
jgi:hypothetical protein